MLSEQRLNHIAEMEKTLNQANALMDKMAELQQQWEALFPQIQSLQDYYFGGEWQQDYDAYDLGEIPPNFPCGVLSQDAVYDFVLSQSETARQWIELSEKVLAEEDEENATE